jgi:hypothetical protein
MDPEHPVAGKGDGLLLRDMDADLIDAFVAASTGDAGSALLSAEIRQLGGAIARPAPDHGALSAIEEPYVVFAVGAAPSAEMLAMVERQVSGVKAALSPWQADHGYLNFAERPVDSRRLYAHAYTYRRLQAIKAHYDPSDTIQSNHPIRPAA